MANSNESACRKSGHIGLEPVIYYSGSNFIGFTGQRSERQEDGTWWQVSEEKLLGKAGTESLGSYVVRRLAVVAE